VMAAGAVGDVKPTDAVLAHVAERHRADWFVASGQGLPTLRDGMAPHHD
jgi:hypothetical protein